MGRTRILGGMLSLAIGLVIGACDPSIINEPGVGEASGRLRPGGLSWGAADPLVVVDVYTDAQCPGCTLSPLEAGDVLTHWVTDVQLRFRHFPLEGHHLAPDAAIALQAAAAQYKAGCLMRRLYRTQDDWAGLDAGAFDHRLGALAQGCGLDMTAFEAARRDPATADIVAADKAEGRALDIPGTPTFLVNGRLAAERPGRQMKPSERLKTVIRRELLLARRLVAQGHSRPQAQAIRLQVNRPAPRPEGLQ